MKKLKKKLILMLAITAGFLFAAGQVQHVDAATREQGTDLSVYQGYSAIFGRSNDKFAISQVGGYYNGRFVVQPTYRSQVSSTLAQGKRVHTYIYSQFSNRWEADQMLNYYLPRVQTPKGSIVALDVESGTPSTDSIMYALNRIKRAGFTPMLYSSKSYASGRFNMQKISQSYALWLAEYKYANVVMKSPDYNWFPSFNNVQIFQFTSTYRAGGLDGNVDLTGITKNGYNGYHSPSTGGKVPNPAGADHKQPNAIKNGLATNKTPKSKIKVGDTVKVNYSANRWANGAGIPAWVHGKSYKVIQVNGNKVLLGGIMSWLNKNNAELTMHSAAPAKAANRGVKYYTVRYGDNLSSIAARYHTTTAKLARLNGISNTNFIRAGQRLKISGQATSTSTGRYRIVKFGDSLSKISYLTGYSINYLAQKNGIVNKNNIYVGQRIYY